MRKSRLSRYKHERLIEHFVSGATARTAPSLLGVHRQTATQYYHRLREIIYQASEDAFALAGETEVDESYFGVKRKGITWSLRSRQGAGIRDPEAWRQELRQGHPECEGYDIEGRYG